MKRGDTVLVPNGADAMVEGVVESVTETHAMVKVPEGSMSLGRRATKALRRLEDLEPVGGEKPKTTKKKTSKKVAKKKTAKKKASKKKASKKLA